MRARTQNLASRCLGRFCASGKDPKQRDKPPAKELPSQAAGKEPSAASQISMEKVEPKLKQPVALRAVATPKATLFVAARSICRNAQCKAESETASPPVCGLTFSH